MKPKVSIVRCSDYNTDRVYEAVKSSIDLLGGMQSFVKPGTKVLVKPNLLMAKEPESGIITHPEVVRAVIRMLKEMGCGVYLGDGPSVWGSQIENIDHVYEVSGAKRIAEEEGVRLVKFDNKRWRSNKFPLTTYLDECDYFINIPKLKTHEFTLLTGAIKNLFGLVWWTHKVELHKKHFKAEDFSRMLADLYSEAKPSLTVVDAVTVLEGDGPATSGKLRNLNLILAGADGVALDSVIALIMGIKPQDVLSTKEAAMRGLGISDINGIEVVGESLDSVTGRPFLLPVASFTRKLPRPVVNIAKRFIKYYPHPLHKICIRCSACIKSCPQKVISMKKGRISINYRGCISCFCCQEICPVAAMEVRRSFVARLAGL